MMSILGITGHLGDKSLDTLEQTILVFSIMLCR